MRTLSRTHVYVCVRARARIFNKFAFAIKKNRARTGLSTVIEDLSRTRLRAHTHVYTQKT